MKIECIGNRGTDLPVQEIDRFGTEHTLFDVSLGREYRVYAMSLGDAFLEVLIADDTGKPGWYPLSLFKVTDSRLPAHWEFARMPSEGGARDGTGALLTTDTARWGYPEVVHSEEHNIGLIEREDEDLRTFHNEQRRDDTASRPPPR